MTKDDASFRDGVKKNTDIAADRSDGGLFTTLVEMTFAGRCGMNIMLDSICSNKTPSIIETLFNEELGAVFQVRKRDEINFRRCFATCVSNVGSHVSLVFYKAHNGLSKK